MEGLNKTGPAKFEDSQGREYRIEFNVGTVKELRTELEFDILDTSEENSFYARLASDPVLVCDVAYLASNARENGIEDEDFGRSMGGGALETALEALMVALINFTRSAKKREALLKMWKKTEEIDQALAERIGEKFDGLDSGKLIDKISGELFSNSPVFSE